MRAKLRETIKSGRLFQLFVILFTIEKLNVMRFAISQIIRRLSQSNAASSMFNSSISQCYRTKLTRSNIADKCSKLPNIQHLGTTAQFPVSYRTQVTVHCDAGFSLVGSNVITCITDDEYQSIHGHLLSCKESKYNLF